jgi:hypothetical protein
MRNLMNEPRDRKDNAQSGRGQREPEQLTPEKDEDVNEALDPEERPTSDRPA